MSFISRFSIASSSLLLVAALHAQTLPQVLTEEEAVRIALANTSVASFNTAQLDLTRAEARREALWPNPTFDFTREAAGANEDFLTLSQSFDFSGRRSLRRRAATLRVEAMRSDVAVRQLDLTQLVRSEFNRAVSQHELVEGLARWSERIAEAAATAQRLQEGGEVSGYDRRRLDRERAGAEARLAAERGALVAAQRRLAALLGVENLDGVTMQRSSTGIVVEGALQRIEQRPDIVAIGRRLEAAELEARAARRWQIPEVSLTGGAKKAESDDGSIVGFGLSLPLFNRNQDELLRTNALVALLRAERSIRIARARGEVGALIAEAEALRRAADRFRQDALPSSERLTATAEAAYRAGEVGILELLDAYRTALDAEIEAAQFDRRARQIEIELARAIGETKE